MPFHENAIKLTGEVIWVVPEHGYGWRRVNEDGSYIPKAIEVPAQFQLRLVAFFRMTEVPNVAFGRIVEEKHPFQDLWAAIIPLMDGAIDDLATPSYCATRICPEKPGIDDSVRPLNNISIIVPNGKPHYAGVSVACASLQLINKRPTDCSKTAGDFHREGWF